jgi:hypothetical protein
MADRLTRPDLLSRITVLLDLYHNRARLLPDQLQHLLRSVTVTMIG